MATIYIKDLVIESKHGVHKHEKLNSQRFRVSVELMVDTTTAGRSDNLADTINWSAVRQLIISTVRDNCFNLMERLAREIANNILVDTRIDKVHVCIDKLDAYKDCVPGITLEVTQDSPR